MSGYFWTFLALLALSDYFLLIWLISVSLQWQRGGGHGGAREGRSSQLLIYCSFTIIDLKRSIDLKWLFQCYYSSLDDHVAFSFILFKAEKSGHVITSKVCFCIQGSRLYGRYDGTGKVWWRIIAIFARVLSIMRWESCSAGGEWEECILARLVCGQNTKWFVGILFGLFDVLWYFSVHFFWVYCLALLLGAIVLIGMKYEL